MRFTSKFSLRKTEIPVSVESPSLVSSAGTIETSVIVTVASVTLASALDIVARVVKLLLVGASLMLSSRVPLPALIEPVESQPVANRRPKATTAGNRIEDRYLMVGNTSIVIESAQIAEVNNGPTSGMPFAARTGAPERLCRMGRRWQNPDSGRAKT